MNLGTQVFGDDEVIGSYTARLLPFFYLFLNKLMKIKK